MDAIFCGSEIIFITIADLYELINILRLGILYTININHRSIILTSIVEVHNEVQCLC